MTDEEDKVVSFPMTEGEQVLEDGTHVKVLDVGNDIAPPFICFPGRNDLAGVAARAAMLRFADIIAHENLEAATDIRKGVLEIENHFGRTTS